MASVPSTGYRIIESNRRFDDYASMKQYFKNAQIKELIFSGSQASSVTTTMDSSDTAIGTLITAEEVVFISLEADDTARQDLESVWVTYQDITGEIHGPILHLINDTADNTIEAPLGNEDVFDTVDTCDGTKKLIQLDNLAGTLNQYAGLYMVVRLGDQVGTAHHIASNDNATPTELVLTTACADINMAGDTIQIQEFPCDDFFRVREMYCGVSPADGKQIFLGTHDMGVIYAAISEDGRYSAHSGFFTQPAATCASYIGRIRARGANTLEAAAADSGQIINITFTPIAANTDGACADITMSFQFTNDFLWEPCIELEPATDVVIAITDIITATLVHVEATYLEVYDAGYTSKFP